MRALISVVGEYTIVGEERVHIREITRRALSISWSVLYSIVDCHNISRTLAAEVDWTIQR